MTPSILALYGLKYNPFRPDVPVEALYTSPALDAFVRRIVLGIADGGFAMITGDPGTGKSVALRIIAEYLKKLPDIMVGTIEHPQSRTSDFYRELGDLFNIPLSASNRWTNFKMLRERWSTHICASLTRPVLIIDEAQETLSTVLNELRVLSSKSLDSQQLLCVIFAGDLRLPERLRTPDLLPLGSRIRRRLTFDYADRDHLLACFEHLLAAAGNSALMTDTLKNTLVDHCAGNYRVLMNLADELLFAGAERELPRLDEKLYFDVFNQQPSKLKPTGGKKK